MNKTMRRGGRILSPAPLAIPLAVALAAALPAGAAGQAIPPAGAQPPREAPSVPPADFAAGAFNIRASAIPPAPAVSPASAPLAQRTAACPFLGPYNPDFDAAAADGAAVRAAPPAAAPVPVSMTGCRTAGRPALAARLPKSFAAAGLAQERAFAAYDRGDYAGALSGFRDTWSRHAFPDSALMLGQMALYGQGTPADGAQAVYWLDRLAGGRFDPALDGMRFDPARPQLMSSQAQAAFMLARMYERGIGVEADPARAARWYAKAAEFGFVPALAILADGWNSGEFGRRDEAKAHDYRARAAKAGYVTASRG